MPAPVAADNRSASTPPSINSTNASACAGVASNPTLTSTTRLTQTSPSGTAPISHLGSATSTV